MAEKNEKRYVNDMEETTNIIATTEETQEPEKGLEKVKNGIITAIDDNRRIMEIDNVPALKKYAEWTGFNADELMGQSLLNASIPMTIVSQLKGKFENRPTKFICCGFGVGLSWGTVAFETSDVVISDLVELDENMEVQEWV